MEYKYYTQEYQEYAEELTGIEAVKSYKDSLTENVNTVSQLQEKLQADIEGMAGDSYNELSQTSIGTILDSLADTKKALEEDLTQAIETCESLSEGLQEIKTSEETLIEQQGQKSTLESNPVSRGKYDEETQEYSNQKNYDSYHATLDKLNKAIKDLIAVCEQLKVKDDKDIEIIKAFNDSIEEFTSQLFSLSITLGNTDFSDFKNLSTEEKEKLVQTFIDALEARYNELSDLREQTLECFDPDKLLLLNEIFGALGWGNGINSLDLIYGGSGGSGTKFNAQAFLDLMETLTTPVVYTDSSGQTVTRTPLDVATGYMGGETWQDSGMMMLYYLNTGQYDPGTEDKFMMNFILLNIEGDGRCDLLGGEKLSPQDIQNKWTPEMRQELYGRLKEGYLATGRFDQLKDYVNTLTTNYDEYLRLTYEMQSTNTTRYNLMQLKKHIP